MKRTEQLAHSGWATTIASNLAAHSGQLQLNAYEPHAGLAVIESQALLFSTSIAFRTKCIDGITLNKKVLAHYLETTAGIVTALNPIVGYEKATELAAEAYKSGKGILEIIREKKIFDRQFLTCDGRFRNIWDEHDCRVKQQWRKQLYA